MRQVRPRKTRSLPRGNADTSRPLPTRCHGLPTRCHGLPTRCHGPPTCLSSPAEPSSWAADLSVLARRAVVMGRRPVCHGLPSRRHGPPTCLSWPAERPSWRAGPLTCLASCPSAHTLPPAGTRPPQAAQDWSHLSTEPHFWTTNQQPVPRRRGTSRGVGSMCCPPHRRLRRRLPTRGEWKTAVESYVGS